MMPAVVFEDEWLLIVDKPAGLLVIPTPKQEIHTLTNILNQELKKENRSYRAHPCHRIDRDTSGLIIYAKGKSTQKKMMDKFKNREIKKTYIAFVRGTLPKDHGEIRNAIEGRSALTRYKVIERRKGFSVVEVAPLTGRKNQIRLHFKLIGSPILGETRFAFRRVFKIKAKRLCLHAKTLEFMHPITGQKVRVVLGLPDKLKEFIKHN